MKILLGIGHPADVHVFKRFIIKMDHEGHQIFVAARDKDLTCYLLDQLHIAYHKISSHQKTVFKKALNSCVRWVRTYRLCQKIKPDIALGVGDFYLPQIGKLQGFPAIVLTDTETAAHDVLLTFPFASAVITPKCYTKDLPSRQHRYDGYQELAYLHPAYFTPDPHIYRHLGLSRDQAYVVFRFVERSALHDIGTTGLSTEFKRKAVHEFSKCAHVFISSEQRLPEDLKRYTLPVPPEKVHHALYYAHLLYGESATMTSEAACLGTPAIYIDDRGRGYTREQESKYGLVFNFTNSAQDRIRSLDKGREILTTPGIKTKWHTKRDTMLADRIDLTDFLISFVRQVIQK